MLYLQKSNQDGVCWCSCKVNPETLAGFATIPGLAQGDCPWCGCGWLFSCISCRKAFTFARTTHVDKTPEDIARLDLSGFLDRPLEDSDTSMVISSVDTLSHLSLDDGAAYAILDTRPVMLSRGPVRFMGLYGYHDLPELPQLKWKPRLLDTVYNPLATTTYWRAARRARAERLAH